MKCYRGERAEGGGKVKGLYESKLIVPVCFCSRELQVARQQGPDKSMLNGPRLNRSMSIT